MKTVFLTILFFFTLSNTFGAPNITAKTNNGSWTANATWDLNRNPTNGDTVTIPSGITVQINSNISTSGNTLYIIVNGSLKFNGGGSKLIISSGSMVIVEAGGVITSTGSPSQILSIGGTSVFDGTDAPVIGPQYANNTTGTGFKPILPLPVKFTSFNVSYNNHSAFIHWSTAEELNAKDFTIEKSIDGKNWNNIAVIKAKGNTNYTSDYTYTDNDVNAATQYYRIKETDITGELTYTSIKSIKTDQNNLLNIAISSIGNGKVLIQFSSEIKGTLLIQYISLTGQVVTKQELSNPTSQQILTNNFLHGNYFISITNEQGMHIAKQIIL